MSLPAVFMIGGGALVGVGVAVMIASGGGKKGGGLRAVALSAVAEVVPSTWPDARFFKMAPGYDPDDPNLPKGFTTCGYLPPVVGHALGQEDGITAYGVEGARTRGKKMGSWVSAKPGRRPRGGDILCWAESPSGGLVHVGVMVRARGDTLTTADAGQKGEGGRQAALYVTRPIDWRTFTTHRFGKTRYLVGWIDIERHVALAKKKDKRAQRGSANRDVTRK